MQQVARDIVNRRMVLTGVEEDFLMKFVEAIPNLDLSA